LVESLKLYRGKGGVKERGEVRLSWFGWVEAGE
jgi:hypothetical protein